MGSLLLLLVAALLVFAALDLFVGVSNDACNFLNSAVGARVAPFGVIVLVASAGVLIGATSSSGMMEIARSGMFRPEKFSLLEIMAIFSAVMIADVLLLNIFNSLGLPTSTTVSIIFELLGAAVCAGLFSIARSGLGYDELGDYLKLGRTATIVSGILLSVVIAFTAGMCVQFFCRLLFSFRFERSVKYLGGIFCGLSMSCIAYFMFIKGAHGASFMTKENLDWIDSHMHEILWGFFIVFAVIGQAMVWLRRDVFKLIVLSGTFALAFAFAGNDLVNFVGVPLAALDGYHIWEGEGFADPALFMLDGLNQSDRAATFWLLLSGLIMCLTLFVSKKARQVVQATVNLSSSSSGQHEQFGATRAGRMITRFGLAVSRAVYTGTPSACKRLIGSRYTEAEPAGDRAPVAFDVVRASVNLVVASAMISMATSMKLPLSTTYVTFMVAMGTSFADGAWDRESAVYRISGVLTVIAGWFVTGFCAFMMAFLVCALIMWTHGVALFVLIPLVLGLIVWSNFLRKQPENLAQIMQRARSDSEILKAVTKAVPAYFDQELDCIRRTYTDFFSDDERALKRTLHKASNIEEAVSENRSAYYDMSLYGEDEGIFSQSKPNTATVDGKFFFYQVFTNMNEAASSVRGFLTMALEHVANRHAIFKGELQQSLSDLILRLDRIRTALHTLSEDPQEANVQELMHKTRKFNSAIDRCQKELVSVIAQSRLPMHASEIYLHWLSGMRDVVNRYGSIGMQVHALKNLAEPAAPAAAEAEASGEKAQQSGEEIRPVVLPEAPSADPAAEVPSQAGNPSQGA